MLKKFTFGLTFLILNLAPTKGTMRFFDYVHPSFTEKTTTSTGAS